MQPDDLLKGRLCLRKLAQSGVDFCQVDLRVAEVRRIRFLGPLQEFEPLVQLANVVEVHAQLRIRESVPRLHAARHQVEVQRFSVTLLGE